jgi:hypothetical protein
MAAPSAGRLTHPRSLSAPALTLSKRPQNYGPPLRPSGPQAGSIRATQRPERRTPGGSAGLGASAFGRVRLPAGLPSGRSAFGSPGKSISDTRP